MSEDSADATGRDAAPLPTGWTRLGTDDRAAPFALRLGSTGFFACYFAGWIAFQFVREVGWPLAGGLAVLLLGVMVAAVIVVARLRFPQPWVNFDTGQLRTGGRTASFSQIDSAVLFATRARKKKRALMLQFGVTKGPQVIVRLRDSKNQVLDPETARLILEVLACSNVRMPYSSDDPTGRFARYNFPGHLTLEDAIALVESPPAPSEPLPVDPVF